MISLMHVCKSNIMYITSLFPCKTKEVKTSFHSARIWLAAKKLIHALESKFLL